MYSGPALGIWSSPNPFSATPAGTLKRGDNVRFVAPSILGPRPGMDVMAGTSFGSATSLADALAFYGADILLAYDLTKVSLYSGSSFTDFSGAFEPVGDNRMRFEGAARSMFFNTSQGLKVWDGVGNAGQPVNAGNPQGLNITALPDSENGWQPPDSAVAYRYTVCSKDAFGRIIEGPPSGRTTVRNLMTVIAGELQRASNVVTATYNLQSAPYVLHVGDIIELTPGEGSLPAGLPAGPKTLTFVDNVHSSFTYDEVGDDVFSTTLQTFEIATSGALTITLPADASVLNFLRVYRSHATAHANNTPSDEMFQVYESAFLVAADLAAGEISFVDTTPESVLDVPLYTNENHGDGALAARFQPPKALDIAYWASRMWFANTESKQSLQFSILGTGTGGVVAGSDITIFHSLASQVTFQGVAEGLPVGTDEFTVFVNGDSGYNIQRTAVDFCRAVNESTNIDDNVPVNAYYVSTEAGLPGTILLQARSFGDDSSFALYSDNTGAAFAPQLPATLPPLSPEFPPPTSNADRHPAGLSWSDLERPEAVPILNDTLINSDNDAIVRIFPLHYRLLIFKTDGIYTSTNVEPFSIQKLSAYQLIAPDSVAVLEDKVYGLTDQGIITVSDSGVVEISTPIEDILTALGGPTSLDDLSTRAVGVSYPSARQYLLWLVEKNDDDTFTDDNAQAFVFSTLSEGFTRYDFGARCAVIRPSTKQLVTAPTDDNALWLENKTLTNADFGDLTLSVAVATVDGFEVTLSDASDVEVGDVITQTRSGQTTEAVVTAVDGNVVTTLSEPAFVSASATLVKAFTCTVEFNKFTGAAPADMKMTDQVSLLFRRNGVHDMTANFSTEIQTAEVPVTLSQTGWGEFPWGEQPWGSPTEQIRRIEPLPLETANCCQLSVGFETRQARANFEFLGIDVAEHEDTRANHG